MISIRREDEDPIRTAYQTSRWPLLSTANPSRRFAPTLAIFVGIGGHLRRNTQALAVFIVFGILLAALAMFAAWQHNPQGEFHNNDGIQWTSWLSVGASWFVAAQIPSAVGWVLFSAKRIFE